MRIAAARGSTDELRRVAQFENTPDFAATFARIVAALDQVHATSPIAGIGVAQPGTMDAARRLVTAATYVPQWIGQPYLANLEDRFGCPAMSLQASCSVVDTRA